MRHAGPSPELNQGFEYRALAGADAQGLTVVSYLAGRYRHSSAAEWTARVDGGQVQVDGRVAAPDTVLRAGQLVAWTRPPWAEPVVPLDFALLHLDGHVLAVAKPRGLPTVPAGGFLTHTLLHQVRRRWPEAVPMHRLGRGTSGLVLFARTEAARVALACDWRERRVEKAYRALVRGIPSWSAHTVEAPIGPVAHPRLGQIHAASAGGRPALTHLRVLARRDGNAVVEAVIPTGRPHQIRIHCAVAGHPLVGDAVYADGGGLAGGAGLPGEAGYWLHAQRLAFAHPAEGRTVRLECVPPAPLRG